MPTSALDEDFFERSGTATVGEVLSQLPSLTSTTVLQNQQTLVGTVGLNNLNLRGLGEDRTLCWWTDAGMSAPSPVPRRWTSTRFRPNG